MKQKNSLNAVIDAVVPLVIYCFCQVALTLGYMGYLFISDPALLESWRNHTIDVSAFIFQVMTPVLIISSVIAVIVILVWKRLRKQPIVKELTTMSVSVPVLLLLVVATFFGIFASNVLSEYLALPNLAEDLFTNMSMSYSGMMAIGIVGPIAEEYVFRSAMLGGMMRSGAGKWTAIIVSSVVFGVVHGNPAQIPFAIIVGFLLGMLYVKTGSLVPCIVCHVINNCTSVYLMNRFSDNPDVTIGELMGSEWLPVVFAVVGTAFCVWVFMKATREERVAAE